MSELPQLPEFLWAHSVETDHYEEYQPWRPSSNIDGKICQACRDFCKSVIQGNLFVHCGWIREKPTHSMVTHITRYAWASHCDGEYMKLKSSAESGCELCALFIEIDRQTPVLQSFQSNVFPDDVPNPEDICHRICIDRYDDNTERTAASHEFQLEFYRRSSGPEVGRGYRSLGGPREPTPRLPKSADFYFLRYADDTDPKALFSESVFHDDPIGEVVVHQTGWPIPMAADSENRGSVQSLMRARKWLWQCITVHERCSRKATVLPKRVVDIGVSPDSLIRLRITEPNETAVHPYIALSYSWGKDLPLRTITGNLQEHCHSIPFDAIPRTLQDAIHVTRGLGLRYIWIDALCIVQDDEKDWEEQAAMMGEIYQGSILNVSATSCTSLSSGFLCRSGKELSPRVRVGKYFHKDGKHGGGIYIGLFKSLGSHDPPSRINEAFLASRGWVFQEQLMSTATLHYTEQEMVWECATITKNEKLADAHNLTNRPMLDGYSRLVPVKWGWINYLRSAPPKPFQRERDGILAPSKENNDEFDIVMAMWKEWLWDFSNRNLTYGNDRLSAIAGITQQISEKYGVHYAAGHFEEDLPLSLCWMPGKIRTVSLGQDPSSKLATMPSWSWASFQGGIWFGSSRKVYTLQISHSQTASDIKILSFIRKSDQQADIHGGSSVCFEIVGLLQEIQLSRTYDEYYITSGVKLPPNVRWRAVFDNGPPAGIIQPLYLLRIVGYNEELYDLHYPLNVGHEGPPVVLDHAVVSRLRQNPDNVWCLILEKVPSADSDIPTFRRVGKADTNQERNEHVKRGGDVFLDPKRLKMRLV